MKKKVIIVSGYFNPLHKGHIEYFKNAKNYGDALFVNNSYLSRFDRWKFKIKFILLNNKFRDAVLYIFLKIKKL